MAEEPQGPLSKELPSSFAGNVEFYEEGWVKKLGRKLKEEPLIPIGCAATCWALYSATKSIRHGDSYTTQRMFRMRLYAQAFTIVAMVGGSLYYNTDRVLRKEYFKLKAEQKKQEKREAWLRELEARDQEDKEWREKMGRMRVRQREMAEAEMAESMSRQEVETLGEGKKGLMADAFSAEMGNGEKDAMIEERSATKAIQAGDGKDGEGGGGPVTKAVKGLKEKVQQR